MSFKKEVISEISALVNTREPLYKITYMKPHLTVNDDPDSSDSEDDDYTVPVKYHTVCRLGVVIFDKSTWIKAYTAIEWCPENHLDELWHMIIDIKHHNHSAKCLGIETPSGQHIVVRKLSIELLN